MMSGSIMSICSTKGGVGKSTLTRLLGITLAEMEKRVLIIDLCQNSSIASNFMRDRDSFTKSAYDWLVGEAKPSEVFQKHNDYLYYVPSDERVDDFEQFANKKYTSATRIKSLKERIEPLRKSFDYILIDTHPSENSDLVSYAIYSSDLCLIPLEIDNDSFLASKRSIEIVEDIRTLNPDLKHLVIPNKVSRSNGKLLRQLEEMRKQLQEITNFTTTIRHSDVISTLKNDRIMFEDAKNQYAEALLNDVRDVRDVVNLTLKLTPAQ